MDLSLHIIWCELFALLLSVYAPIADAELPEYVHVHTLEELLETRYVLLDNSNVCQDSHSDSRKLLIAIKTAPTNHYQREVLRQSWLTEAVKYHIPYVFVLGFTTDEKVLNELLMENAMHEDLLIGKPVDDYYNLTLKGIFLLGWARTYCPTSWLLYVDDDIILNVEYAMYFVSSVKNGSQQTIYCEILRSEVIRDPTSKWFMPVSVWKASHYPDYCKGYGYLIPPNALSILHETSIKNSIEPKLWFEDVFITGIIRKAADVRIAEVSIQCCSDISLELFKKSLFWGEIGKGEKVRDKWMFVQGNSSNGIKVLPTRNVPVHKISRFYPEGLLLTWNTQTDRNLKRPRPLMALTVYIDVHVSTQRTIYQFFKPVKQNHLQVMIKPNLIGNA
ncbi:unnamed protein product [Rotaria magnacalcarata]|uniref:Hexosyltransferase n=1 Tax=Rotaria magnacalcarata TaxID=392030 RepID=A0A817A5N1_9BILA|nr:unnamed protein product [Rotaria magnacalcarata]